jgi:hypothetical protein
MELLEQEQRFATTELPIGNAGQGVSWSRNLVYHLWQ